MPRAEIIGLAAIQPDGTVTVSVRIPADPPHSNAAQDLPLVLGLAELPDDGPTALFEGPEPWPSLSSRLWVYHGKHVQISDDHVLTTDEMKLEVMQVVAEHEKRYADIRKQLELVSLLDQTDSARRERIPDEVRLFVWHRDEGKCVQCGSNERLEFDHIIPVSKGGSNTARNIQLLCEQCNRAKSADIVPRPRLVP